MERQYYEDLAVAYVRGALSGVTANTLEEWIKLGQDAQLRMYHFKIKEQLPRVKAVMGFLKGIQPESLLDVGSGRGVFLFPFLDEFPWVEVTSVDILPHRVQMLQSIAKGGVENLHPMQKNICMWKDEENLFDVVTLLEVLEHIPDVQQAVTNAVRLAKRYVVVSVPSKPDDNPEHIHLLTKDVLTTLFANAGCQKLHFGGVNGHLVMMATVEKR